MPTDPLAAMDRVHRGRPDDRDLGVPRCRIVDLPVIHDRRGNLTPIEGGRHIDFDIARVYYLYDVPGGAERGGHAHRALHQLIIAMSGSFDVVVDDGSNRGRCHLNRSYRGLYVPPMIWREMDNFSSGSVCLVLASAPFDEDDYIRDYDAFRATVAAG
jgi:WxcM-like, C-terminal